MRFRSSALAFLAGFAAAVAVGAVIDTVVLRDDVQREIADVLRGGR